MSKIVIACNSGYGHTLKQVKAVPQGAGGGWEKLETARLFGQRFAGSAARWNR
jgi:hypothetical protein